MDKFSEIKNLIFVSKEEQQNFFGSFDRVLSDMDEVIWHLYEPFPGASECITNLKKLGKPVTLVTNNSHMTIEAMGQYLEKYKFPLTQEDIVNPSMAYIEYLKKNNFSKLIYVVGGQSLQEELINAGFKLAPNPTNPIEESVPAVLDATADNEDIGAVIVDFDLNLTLLKLQRCLTYLKRNDCLFIVGSTEKALPFTQTGPLIGTYVFCECLKDLSGRKPYQLAKPSADFKDFITEKLSIVNPKRVLFIGDSINTDMRLAGISGYKKLLVLTGSAKREDVVKWTHGEDSKPDYYVESLEELNILLKMIHVHLN